MQFFFATPQRLHRVHSHFFVVVLGMTEGGFLLPELLAALTVDVQRHSRSVVLRRIIRHLLHSTAKAHSAAHKITAVIEIHAHRSGFSSASPAPYSKAASSYRSGSRSGRSSYSRSAPCSRKNTSRSGSQPVSRNFLHSSCISIRDSCASCFRQEHFQVRVQLHLLPEQPVLHFEQRAPVPLRDHHAGFQPLRLVHQLFVLRQHFLCCHSPFCIQIPPPYFLSGIFLYVICCHGICARPVWCR